jgi:SRSO17 transposase
MGTDAVSVHAWGNRFEQLIDRISRCFGRCDLQERAEDYLHGLLGPVQRKNNWQLAEYVGDAKPYGLQRLLGRACWDADALRDLLVHYAAEHLLAPGEGGVLIADETGFLKKGRNSVGVQRQYSGTAGRIENCQIGVFLALAGSRGRTLIDRELYLPKDWSEDAPRRAEAGVPLSTTFATKPQLARRMLDRAFAAGLKPRWVLADEVYGNDSTFRRHLETLGQPFVLAVSCQQRLWVEFQQKRVDRIVEALPERAWFRFRVAEGAKGPRVYDWAAGRLSPADSQALVKWLLVRRSTENPTERAYYLCAAPAEATAEDLAVAAGHRWAIESCFEAGKQETGLDEYEVRNWAGWYRHMTLSMLALAFLAAVRAQAGEPRAGGEKKGRRWSR